MIIQRNALRYLTKWRASNKRKPLIIRGARQVGKTTLIHEFGETYSHFIALNLEKSEHQKYFENFDDVKTILEALLLSYNVSSKNISDTLLFIDEIQACPEVISLLRYFYEDYPDLHVIAAGSLLEFAIDEVESYPVGRVESLHLYPLNFQEFLMGKNESRLLEALNQVPVSKAAHLGLLKQFHQYAIVGGMPEVVSQFIEEDTITDLGRTYDSIWTTYKRDVEHYGKSDSSRKVIRHIMNVAFTCLDQRITFNNFGNSNYKSREVSEAFYQLDLAKVIQVIYPSTTLEPPIEVDRKKRPRIQFLDTGIVNFELKVQAELLRLNDLSDSYKGSLIPHMITQELMSLNTYKDDKPMFWVREKRNSQAEVDLIYQFGTYVIPIEIKSGKTGTLKSLHQFIDACPHCYAIRVYGGEFSVEKQNTPNGKPYFLMNLPYYLGTKIPEYISYLVKEYSIQ